MIIMNDLGNYNLCLMSAVMYNPLRLMYLVFWIRRMAVKQVTHDNVLSSEGVSLASGIGDRDGT